MTDPATGDVIAQVADGSVDDGLAAVAAAAEAGPGWAASAARQRAEILRKGVAADDRPGRGDRGR